MQSLVEAKIMGLQGFLFYQGSSGYYPRAEETEHHVSEVNKALADKYDKYELYDEYRIGFFKMVREASGGNIGTKRDR